MIDWANLFFNTLWILALSIALAVVSWASWQASTGKTRLSAELRQSGPQRMLLLSGFLFSLGLALTSHGVYAMVFWFLLGTYCLVLFVRSIYGPHLPGS